MNKKRMIILVCLGILAVMLLTSVGSAAPADTYVHVVHNYDGTVIGMTNSETCDDADIVTLGQGSDISFSNMIKTTHNGRSYVVDKIELHYELANLEILLLRSGNYPSGFTEDDFEQSMELSRGTETILINSDLPDGSYIQNLFSLSCSSVHVATWPSAPPTNIRKITDVWMTYTSAAGAGNDNGLTGEYPLTGTRITYPSNEELIPNALDITNPEAELADGSHYVLKIFYKEPTVVVYEMDGDVYYRVTFYLNDGVSEPIIKIVRKDSYVTAPILETKEYSTHTSRFEGWYTDNLTYTNRWNPETNKVTQDLDLYAHWDHFNKSMIPWTENDNNESQQSEPPEPEPPKLLIPWGWDTAGTAAIFVILAALIAGRERIKKKE